MLVLEMVKRAIFTQKHKFCKKYANFSPEEHALIELLISIDIIILFSSFEVIVLRLGDKVMTFVLYPLFRFPEIVNDWNATE